MKIKKGILLHRKLRKRQEYLCYEVAMGNRKYLHEFGIYNKTVRKLNKMLPNWYFFWSDVLGYARSLRYVPPPQPMFTGPAPIMWDLIPAPGFNLRHNG